MQVFKRLHKEAFSLIELLEDVNDLIAYVDLGSSHWVLDVFKRDSIFGSGLLVLS